MSNDWMMWAMILQQQAQQAAAARAQAEAEAKAKADADAKAAAEAEQKRQAQIAQQRQQDTAAAQAAEKDRLAAVSKLPGAADPYGEYRASMNLDNSSMSNAGRTVGGSSNPLGGFANSTPGGLTGLLAGAVRPSAPRPTPDFGSSNSANNKVTGGSQKQSGFNSPTSIF